MSTFKDLVAQRDALNQQIEDAKRTELATAIGAVRELVVEYELTQAELFPLSPGKRGRASKSKTPVAPKYKDPASGATWSGRGKPPLWIAGKDRETFVI